MTNIVETSEQPLIRPLFEGPLDIVGDIHGEIDALRALLAKLGYDETGRHPAGRRLVFVGDLCDRGPDSPAVIGLVKGLVERGLAQCVMGNHELNLLRNEPKHGNHWCFPGDHSEHEKTFGPSQRVTAEEASVIRAFLSTLPVALERPDLRVVHAAWKAKEVEACRTYHGTALAAYCEFERQWQQTALAKSLEVASTAEKHIYDKEIETES